jgi:hypothetical protein
VRRLTFRAALALIAGAVLGACGTTAANTTVSTPLTFAPTVTVPTTTLPVPTSTTYLGPQLVDIETGPFLGEAATTHLGHPIDGIQCELLEQLAYHSYAHLQVYVNGRSRALPGGIGMVDPRVQTTNRGLSFSSGTCYYWLHTSAADGVIEVESPTPRHYTLGNFFNVWNQPLDRNQVAADSGKVTAIVNGKVWTRSLHQIPLAEHEDIELAIGRPVPRYTPIDWAGTRL